MKRTTLTEDDILDESQWNEGLLKEMADKFIEALQKAKEEDALERSKLTWRDDNE